MKDELQVENGNFTRIVNKALDALISAPISGSELRIVLAIIRKTYGFQKKEDSISISQLQEITNISKRNIIYLLQNLEAKKIILISRSGYECNIIRFNKYSDSWVVQSYAPQVKENRNRAKRYSAKLRNGVVQSYEGSAKLSKKVVQNYAENIKSFAHTKEKRKDKERGGYHDMEDFNKFYQEYPNKKSRSESEKIWNKLNPSKELVQKIMLSLENHKMSSTWVRDNGQYIPHPSTWLNQKRWEDEVSVFVPLKTKNEYVPKLLPENDKYKNI